MTTVSIICPYFQKEPGILRRALVSVLEQTIPNGVDVNIIVVDDGSPVPAHAEIDGLDFALPFHLHIISQSNAGVAVARNTGLTAVSDTTQYIAFIDSDDSWHPDHLSHGLTALAQGYDFYFCDNRREGHHESNFALGNGTLLPYLSRHSRDMFIKLSREELASIILKDCPAQTSTIIFRRSIATHLLFDTSKNRAGEDFIFLMNLSQKVRTACFSPKAMVQCGTGVNIYFNHLSWDSEGHLQRIIDNLRARLTIKHNIRLTKDNAKWNNKHISKLRRDVVFHALRTIIKRKGRWPNELSIIYNEDKWFEFWFFFYTIQLAVGKPLGLYHPD
jgi:succinoglycan biosynthesis protein ExoW